MSTRSVIGMGVCKDGIESIRWCNCYSVEKVEQEDPVSAYLSEEAVERCREKRKGSHDGSAPEAEDMEATRLYVYTQGRAIPMYMFGEMGVDPVFVNAVTGETTDYPWETDRPWED